MSAGFLRGGAARSGEWGRSIIPDSGIPGYAWGEGACARASVFSSSARGDFFSRRVGERPTRGDATRRRGGAARGRTVVSFAAAFATFATSSGCASATRALRACPPPRTTPPSGAARDRSRPRAPGPPPRRAAPRRSRGILGGRTAAFGARGRGGLRPVHAPARGRGRRGDVHRVHRGERRGARGGVREGGAEGEGDEARGRGENNNERRRNRSAFPRGDKPKIRNGRAVSAALFQDCSDVWNLVSRSRGELGRDDALT